MRQELDEKLCADFPKLFANRHAPMTETAMCWGFDCGDGWYPIIRNLCNLIQSHLDWQNKNEEKVKQVTVDQVKEKFGTLRFYYTGGDNYISGLVSMAEAMSSVTCEQCSHPAERRSSGWIKVLCDSCNDRRERDKQRRMEEYKKSKEIQNDYQFVGEDSGNHD